MKYNIQDWTGKVLFDGKTFDTYDDGWSYIYAYVDTLPNLTDDEYNAICEDYYVELINEQEDK